MFTDTETKALVELSHEAERIADMLQVALDKSKTREGLGIALDAVSRLMNTSSIHTQRVAESLNPRLRNREGMRRV